MAEEKKPDSELVAAVMLWLANITPARVARVYGIKWPSWHGRHCTDV